MKRGAIGRVTVMGLLGVVGLAVSPAPAHACGGLFCDRPPVNPLDPLPVAQSGENVVFGVEGDLTMGTAVVTAHIQVLYSGAAAQFSWVVPVVTYVRGSSSSFRTIGMGFGVVVTTPRGRWPRRSPNMRFDHMASAFLNFASSSHQYRSCCGPRRVSGSLSE